MAQTTIPTDLLVTGDLACGTFQPPAASIGDAAIKSNAAIAATKVVHQFDLNYSQAEGTAVVAETRPIRIVKGTTGVIVSVQAAITGAIATGADRTVTIDVKKGNAATAFATILSAAIVFNNASVIRTVSSGTLSVTSLAAGDQLQVVVTVAGSAGAQAQGLIVSVTVREDPA